MRRINVNIFYLQHCGTVYHEKTLRMEYYRPMINLHNNWFHLRIDRHYFEADAIAYYNIQCMNCNEWPNESNQRLRKSSKIMFVSRLRFKKDSPLGRSHYEWEAFFWLLANCFSKKNLRKLVLPRQHYFLANEIFSESEGKNNFASIRTYVYYTHCVRVLMASEQWKMFRVLIHNVCKSYFGSSFLATNIEVQLIQCGQRTINLKRKKIFT